MDNKSPQEKHEDLEQVVQESNEVLATFRGVFPFDIFPDEVIIDKQSITIIRHFFIGISQRVNSHFDDLVNSEVNLGPFFGSINVYSKYFTEGVERVNWLSRDGAQALHEILQGLLITRKEGVDLKDLSREEIIFKLRQIGKVSTSKGL